MKRPGETVTVELREHEARFLAGVVLLVVTRAELTAQQRAAADAVSGEFLRAAAVATDAFVAEHGEDGAERLAAEALALYPDIERVELP